MFLYTTGATGFEYLRNVNGIQYTTFREAAIAAGYLQDDEEYRRCLEDARRMSMLSQMCALFAYTLSLCECGVDITTIIPPPVCTTAVIDNDIVDVDAYREEGSRLYQTLNAQQKHVVDAVISNSEKCVFIDGPGGSGKTYTCNVLHKMLVGQGKRVLNVAWSGIAATLLPRG
ncbi:hypothetical protein ANCCAN_06097 [Ancylostoma caninum]|uniref:ATP-dependent DNA helicase n=1 Tax=Ancylostoma caninum TaxID=29170 RepID=A0A368GU66_ANCCA|nr:hypothetical protein ANCCAN_06097 [Ancylostoma caninum]